MLNLILKSSMLSPGESLSIAALNGVLEAVSIVNVRCGSEGAELKDICRTVSPFNAPCVSGLIR